ncbi:MAG: N-formylglutamate amidohydrolase [Desulfofustis sp.]|jgi:N-formylglutamate deformylase
MRAKLPVIVSVPHGGEIIAPEMSNQTLLSRSDIFSDGDPLTRQIYDFRYDVAHYFETTIARATIDLNRSPDDLPPVNQDGVIKSHTVTGKGIYRKNRIPNNDTLRLLLKKYYKPYHDGLERRSRESHLLCGLDCHTMLDRAPTISPLPEKRRPFICLSNRGDRQGNKVKGRRLTCPPQMIRLLSRFLQEQFPEEAHSIVLNSPFLGGYIVRQHSKNLPWIQIEVNRRSYLSPEWYDPDNLEVCHHRIAHLRRNLFAAIRDFAEFYYQHTDIGHQVA